MDRHVPVFEVAHGDDHPAPSDHAADEIRHGAAELHERLLRLGRVFELVDQRGGEGIVAGDGRIGVHGPLIAQRRQHVVLKVEPGHGAELIQPLLNLLRRLRIHLLERVENAGDRFGRVEIPRREHDRRRGDQLEQVIPDRSAVDHRDQALARRRSGDERLARPVLPVERTGPDRTFDAVESQPLADLHPFGAVALRPRPAGRDLVG